ncbi:competence type IV pilus major pilin ComGC [Lactococcus sp. NH2-7C]|uniref:competence type IV pilus major pilin ComGC n=2 Tax=Lactococcus sp. NH2-7C TaxID=2879149 RepID=UPI001CDC6816|nr:competence type IV pilus major pilin ComGC [Lactococcus sp. NH2-7C]MCA2390414.1 prepilin-type N-terminal cleavage/methylation domain-containing protein [Lactococcus sp. NH2-7C]
MIKKKDYILKRIQKIFLIFRVWGKKCYQKEQKAFTLIEMLIVLAIISILILLFVPNLIKEKTQVQKTGESAVVKVVESQAQLYELDHNDEKPSLSDLFGAGMITQKQISAYDNYYEQNKNEERNFND